MPIMRDELGVVYTTLASINPLIAPSQVGIFEISSQAKKLVEKPLDKTGVLEIYKLIPPEMDSFSREKGLIPTVAISYWSGSPKKVHERILKSLSPYTNSPGNNEIHLVFAGPLIMYLDKGQGQYALLLQPGDWIYIDGHMEGWPKLTYEKDFTIASYHSAPLAPVDEFHKELKYTHSTSKTQKFQSRRPGFESAKRRRSSTT